MEKIIIGLIMLSSVIFGTIKFTSIFKYLGLSLIEAIAISFLTSTFILAIVGKIMVTYMGFRPLFE